LERSAGRHKGAGAGDVAHGLRHGLAHVGARVEDQAHEGGALDALALDMIDAGDVEEMILVVIRDESFHLRRIHAAVRLRDVNGRRSEIRKNIGGHPSQREVRSERDRQHGHHHSNRPAERNPEQPHVSLPPPGKDPDCPPQPRPPAARATR